MLVEQQDWIILKDEFEYYLQIIVQDGINKY
jgi:hypothetical protein